MSIVGTEQTEHKRGICLDHDDGQFFRAMEW